MAQFKVFTDEKITLWQRVGVIIEAETEDEVRAILKDRNKFVEVMCDNGGEYSGDVEPYLETEEHVEWDNSAPTINKLGA